MPITHDSLVLLLHGGPVILHRETDAYDSHLADVIAQSADPALLKRLTSIGLLTVRPPLMVGGSHLDWTPQDDPLPALHRRFLEAFIVYSEWKNGIFSIEKDQFERRAFVGEFISEHTLAPELSRLRKRFPESSAIPPRGRRMSLNLSSVRSDWLSAKAA